MNLPLDARFLMKGLFCASEAILTSIIERSSLMSDLGSVRKLFDGFQN